MADDLPDFLADFEEPKVSRPNPRKKQLANPFEVIPATEVRRATNPKGKDPSMAGRQLRRGVLLPPEMDEEINRLVKKYGVGKMKLMRYLLAAGLERVHRYGIERDMVETRNVELRMPDWKRDG